MSLHHVGLTVRDLEASVEFYCSILGCRVRGRAEGAGEDLRTLTGVRDAHVRIADLEVPGGGWLELIQYLAPAQARLEQSRPQPGHTHLAFHTEDLDAVHRRLCERGCAPTSQPVMIEDPGGEWHGARAFYATDPDGRTIEFVSLRGAGGAAPVVPAQAAAASASRP